MTAKSDRIKKLLDDGDLQEAFRQVEDAIHRGWAGTPPTQLEDQREWHRRLFTLKSVKENLYRAIEDGKLEDFRALEKERPGCLGDIQTWRKNRQRNSG